MGFLILSWCMFNSSLIFISHTSIISLVFIILICLKRLTCIVMAPLHDHSLFLNSKILSSLSTCQDEIKYLKKFCHFISILCWQLKIMKGVTNVLFILEGFWYFLNTWTFKKNTTQKVEICNMHFYVGFLTIPSQQW